MKRKNIIILGLILILCSLAAFSLFPQKPKNKITYVEFLELLDAGRVESAVVSDSQTIKFKLYESDETYATDNPRVATLKETLLMRNISVSEGSADAMQILPTLMIVGGLFFVLRMTRQQPAAMALNVSKAKENAGSFLSFSDIAGNDEAKESVMDLVDFIKNPEKYVKYGARMPRGVIFYGPPGTGKTLMAKAIAGEAGVPFFAVSGSDFVQMYVGVGASRVRELFKKARSAKKAVIFIDEIDALGKKRGLSTSNDERDQTLNALLTEMSGFETMEGIVVIAATNRLDTLDEALLRPGRFDRQIEIGLPDVSARARILDLYSQTKPLDADVDLGKLAKETVYFSGAMLENLMNEAAIYAAKSDNSLITQNDINKAYYTVIAGSEKKDPKVSEHDRRVTACHEAGHGLVARLMLPDNTVSKITIIPSTKGAGGFCVNIPADKLYHTKRELHGQIMVALAGRAAEEICFGHDGITTGASNDIERATAMAIDYVTKYGMGDNLVNAQLFGEKKISYEECQDLINNLYSETKDLITKNKSRLDNLAQMLIEKETLNEDEVNRCVA